jgi:integrase
VQLSQNGIKTKTGKAVAKVDIKALLKSKCMSQIDVSRHEGVEIHYNTVVRACLGRNIDTKSAESISNVLNTPPEKIFTFLTDNSPLSSRTIRDYHKFISSILREAEKEMIIPYNPANKARPPKLGVYKPNYFQIEDVEKITKALEHEPIKWRTMIHLFLVTGCRLGEIIGLKWEKINWDNKHVLIDQTLQYTPSKGIYEDTPKTKNSIRIINLPDKMMTLLEEYRLWQAEQKGLLVTPQQSSGFIFTNKKGSELNPCTVGEWLRRFSKKYDLPYLNAHAFRHTQASILFFHGIDAVSISKRLGHAKVSTTTDIYSHIMKESDAKICQCVADVIYNSKPTS